MSSFLLCFVLWKLRLEKRIRNISGTCLHYAPFITMLPDYYLQTVSVSILCYSPAHFL
ncbi:hypothetical protein Krac_0304 [Ktedonobacter racemifer DSM 44963]|uniref:Uncharacterized protein n=1 Tax=Ktedonobacter racemifer DSM 44963 TaxID=485913 RepID=D6U7D5_KTERA|nr:hypothetical protein Krac_0304 [Ktedonobacter racemifer DSM 44963]